MSKGKTNCWGQRDPQHVNFSRQFFVVKKEIKCFQINPAPSLKINLKYVPSKNYVILFFFFLQRLVDQLLTCLICNSFNMTQQKVCVFTCCFHWSLIFSLIFIVINHVTLLKQTHLFLFIFLRISPIIFRW